MSLKNLLTNFFQPKPNEPVLSETEPLQPQSLPEATQEPYLEVVQPIPKEEEKPEKSVPKKRGWSIGRLDKKGNEICTNKYTEDQKLFIVTCIGYCMSPEEIAEAFKEKYDLELNKPSNLINVYRRANKWREMIQGIRQKYLADIRAVAGAHKRVRLDRADRVYDRALRKKDLKHQLGAIEQQRKEVEKYEDLMLDTLRDEYAKMSDEEIKERKNWLLMKLKEKSNGTG